MSDFTAKQQYVINLVAPLIYSGGPKAFKSFDFLNNSKLVKKAQEIKDEFEIEDLDDLSSYIRRLEPNNKSFARIRNSYLLLNEEQRTSHLESKIEPAMRNRYRIIKKYGCRLDRNGIEAYDYAYGLLLGCYGFILDLYYEDEFWQIMFDVAIECQEVYEDWEHYFYSLVVGIMYVNDYKKPLKIHNEIYYINKFFQRKSSTYKDTPWNIELR